MDVWRTMEVTIGGVRMTAPRGALRVRDMSDCSSGNHVQNNIVKLPTQVPSAPEETVNAWEEFSPAGDPGDDLLTRNLKRAFDEVAAEAIPEEWLAMLQQLEEPPPGGDDA
jgi:hypothetical protein